ncbi:MAG: adenosylcobinamide-GDP ribazoletransferase [Panacagrimonas sp.]
MVPALIALQFLTRLPLRLPGPPTPTEHGQALLWYPLVGVLIGMLLALAALALDHQPPLLGAALLLCLWVAITGALHLDGLADSADAWAGGRGDAQRCLAIMKDPAAGPVAVVAVVLVLLLKFAALCALMPSAAPWLLLLPPLLGRTSVPVLFLTSAYVRADGLGAAAAQQLPRAAAMAVVALVLLGCAWIVGPAGLVAIAAMAAAFAAVRYLAQRHLGGFTGDVAGALVELTETAVVVALAIAAD